MKAKDPLARNVHVGQKCYTFFPRGKRVMGHTHTYAHTYTLHGPSVNKPSLEQKHTARKPHTPIALASRAGPGDCPQRRPSKALAASVQKDNTLSPASYLRPHPLSSRVTSSVAYEPLPFPTSLRWARPGQGMTRQDLQRIWRRRKAGREILPADGMEVGGMARMAQGAQAGEGGAEGCG